MAQSEARPLVKLRSTGGTGFTYVTRKNRRTHPDRGISRTRRTGRALSPAPSALVLRKYDPVLRRHVEFREER